MFYFSWCFCLGVKIAGWDWEVDFICSDQEALINLREIRHSQEFNRALTKSRGNDIASLPTQVAVSLVCWRLKKFWVIEFDPLCELLLGTSNVFHFCWEDETSNDYNVDVSCHFWTVCVSPFFPNQKRSCDIFLLLWLSDLTRHEWAIFVAGSCINPIFQSCDYTAILAPSRTFARWTGVWEGVEGSMLKRLADAQCIHPTIEWVKF